MTGEIDPVSQMLGELKATTDKTAEMVDIIRTDQVNARREIDYLKTTVMEIKNIIPVVKDHMEIIGKVEPLIPTLNDVATARRVGRWGVRTAVVLGGANLLGPLGTWIKAHIHLGTQ